MGRVFRVKGSKKWKMDYVNEHGKRVRKSTGTTDKGSASQLLAAMEKRVTLYHAGVMDDSTSARSDYAKQSVQQWIDDYIASLAMGHAEGNRHVSDSRSKIEKFCAEMEIVSPSQLTEANLVAYTTRRREKEKLAARTLQSYIVAIKGFVGWCVRSGRMMADPLGNVTAPSPAKDRRYVRRALSHEEWRLLRAAAINGPVLRCIPGEERVLLYELAIVTGLRAKEIRSLTRGSFVLDGTPYVLLPAADTKNGKPCEQLLTPDLAERLRKHLKTKILAAPAFACGDVNRLAFVLRKDMEAARAAWLAEVNTVDERAKRLASDFLLAIDHDKRRIDFHALRYTCGAWLSLAGIHPKAIQSVMRHSTIRLTMDTYGHLFPQQATAAIEAIARALRVS